MLVAKALHIIAMVAWFAGLFYLPRLFVYHADAFDKISQDRFIVMENKLFYYIMNPAAVLTLLLGLHLLHYNFNYYLHAPWMLVKIALVILLVGYHILCGILVHKFKCEQNHYSSKFFRFFNEVPTLLLVAIVFLVILKP